MTNVCENCKDKTMSDYWLNSTKHSFFKIMLNDYEDRLRIPRKFAENFQENLSNWCTLRGPSGNEWNVRITVTREDVLLRKGWDTFVKDHGLKLGDFLVFTYKGNSTFKVSVFDPTGCEKEGAYYAEVNMSRSADCASVFHSVSENEMTDSESSLGRNYSSESRDYNKAENTHYNAVYKGKWKVRTHPESTDSSVVKDERIDIDDDDDDEQEEEQEMNPSFSGRPRGKQVQRYHVSRRREVTEEEKRRAGKRADEYIKKAKSDGFPMVGITMLPTHVYKGLKLTIPKKWAVNHMIRENHEVELRIPGSNDFWLVGARWISSRRNRQCQLSSKWPEFVLDNNLEEGGVCVFKLIHKGETKSVFEVKIFRVVQEVVPLIPKRGAF